MGKRKANPKHKVVAFRVNEEEQKKLEAMKKGKGQQSLGQIAREQIFNPEGKA